jgi:hypothetical protein
MRPYEQSSCKISKHGAGPQALEYRHHNDRSEEKNQNIVKSFGTVQQTLL